MNYPLVSIIIPCHNSANYVSAAIDSALNQTYRNTEILLVDNNSTDNTLEILFSYQSWHPNKITVIQERKQGAPAARNKGLLSAKGKWIQFLDSDDVLMPDKIANQLKIATIVDASLVVGNFLSVSNERVKKNFSHKDFWIGLILSELGITSANLFKKGITVEIGGWREQLSSSQEYELMFRLLKRNIKVAYDENFYTIINRREESIGRGSEKIKAMSILRNRINLRLEIYNYLDQLGMLNTGKAALIEGLIYKLLFINKKKHRELLNEFKPRMKFKNVPKLLKIKILIKNLLNLS